MNEFDALIGFSVNPEIIWRPEGECLPGQKTRATAELIVSGTSYDVALAMQACGCRPYLLGAVGDDPFARLLESVLNVPHCLLPIREKTCLASVEPQTGRHLSFKPPIVKDENQLVHEILAANDIAFRVVTGLMDDPNEIKLAADFLNPNYLGGIRVLNPREALCSRRPMFEEIARLCDCLFLNRFEAAAYLGGQPKDIDLASAEAFLDRGLAQRVVIITRDGDGALGAAFTGWRAVSPSHFNGDKIDEKGAGDCFLGFFLSALRKGSDFNEAFRLAVVAAGIKVTRPGTTNLPGREEVVAVINKA